MTEHLSASRVIITRGCARRRKAVGSQVALGFSVLLRLFKSIPGSTVTHATPDSPRALLTRIVIRTVTFDSTLTRSNSPEENVSCFDRSSYRVVTTSVGLLDGSWERVADQDPQRRTFDSSIGLSRNRLVTHSVQRIGTWR